jgi:hypothetical protein
LTQVSEIDRRQPEPAVLLELGVVEQRYQAVREVLDGASGRSPKKRHYRCP